jgi:hypothetical protein
MFHDSVLVFIPKFIASSYSYVIVIVAMEQLSSLMAVGQLRHFAKLSIMKHAADKVCPCSTGSGIPTMNNNAVWLGLF